VVTQAEIVIDNDVILDGEGQLTLDAGGVYGAYDQAVVSHRVLSVASGTTVQLLGMTITGAVTSASGAYYDSPGILNEGTLTLVDSTVRENLVVHQFKGPGTGNLVNDGDMEVVRSTIALGNAPIFNTGTLTLINSTVSEDDIVNRGTLALRNSTVLGLLMDSPGTVTMANSLLVGQCEGVVGDRMLEVISLGYNIHSGVVGSEGECTLDQSTDRFIASEVEGFPAAALKLGLLQENGGPTMTHALGQGSVAIDVIPEAQCEVDIDQRLQPRASMCDVGAFEVQQGACLGSSDQELVNAPGFEEDVRSCRKPESLCLVNLGLSEECAVGCYFEWIRCAVNCRVDCPDNCDDELKDCSGLPEVFPGSE